MQNQDHVADGDGQPVRGDEGRTALHTPLPWKAVTPCPGECCWHLVPADFDETALKRENWHEFVNLPEMSEADAKFIVRCVNAHGALLAALEKIADGTPDALPPFRALGATQMQDIARAAIAAAADGLSR